MRINRATNIVAQLLAVVGLVLLVSFAVGTLADGLLRRFAGRPIDAVRDLGGLIVAVAIACCFPLALTQRSNITIKFVAEFVGRRIALYFDAAAAVIVELVILLIARQFFIYASALARSGDATTMLAIPTAPFWFVVSGVLGIAALAQCSVTMNQLWAVTERVAP